MATGTKIALVVEYDGTRYHGFQLQANAPTIQGEIEESLLKLTGQKSRIKGASRTDAGVHAQGQVASFRTRSSLPLQTFVKGLNHYLPEDIAIKEAFRISDSFDVRRRAISREYKYYIWNSSTRSPLRRSSAHLVSDNLDTEAMNQACQALIGKHNFASFATSPAHTFDSVPANTAYKATCKRLAMPLPLAPALVRWAPSLTQRTRRGHRVHRERLDLHATSQ